MEANKRNELEFERINEKLNIIFNNLRGLIDKVDRLEYDKRLKELTDKAECAEKEVQWHSQSERYLEEGTRWPRNEWENIDKMHYQYMNNTNVRDDRVRVDVPERL